MPSYEAWEKLIPNDWASCVKIHNLPFSFKSLVKTKTIIVFNLGQSAETWNYFDFMDSLNRNRE
jgi:hypothetical protein